MTSRTVALVGVLVILAGCAGEGSGDTGTTASPPTTTTTSATVEPSPTISTSTSEAVDSMWPVGDSLIAPSPDLDEQAPVVLVDAGDLGWIRGMVADGVGHFWLAAGAGAVWVDLVENQALVFRPAAEVEDYPGFSSVVVGPRGDVWFDGPNRVVHFDGAWTSYPVQGFSSWAGAGVLVAARDGTVWYSGDAGVSQWTETGFTRDPTWPEVGGIIAESADGTIWAQAIDGIARWDGDWQVFTSDVSRGTPMFGSPGAMGPSQAGAGPPVDPDGAYWFGSWNGVLRFADGGWTTIGASDGIPTDCLAVAVDVYGTLWTGCEYTHLYAMELGESVLVEQEWWTEATQGLGYGDVEFITPTSSGSLWIASDLADGGGVVLVQGDTHTAFGTMGTSLGYPVTMDPFGALWLMAGDDQGGFVRITPTGRVDEYPLLR